jgi:HSP20 family protein
MPIIKYQPFDSMFDDIFNDESMFPVMRMPSRFAPALDVYEDKNNVMVECAVSGIDPEKIDITVEDNVLKIEGSAEHKSEVDDKNYYRKEIRSGHFYRSVGLPKPVKGSEAKAVYEKGILKITLPKADEAKPKSVKVEIKHD